MARQEGLEPSTYCLEGSCSIQLSYWRNTENTLCFLVERVMGIEPTRPAWKAGILPLNYTRISVFSSFFRLSSWFLSATFCIISHRFRFVKSFFWSFSNFFEILFFQMSVSLRSVLYYITLTLFCQDFFLKLSNFFEVFSFQLFVSQRRIWL